MIGTKAQKLHNHIPGTKKIVKTFSYEKWFVLGKIVGCNLVSREQEDLYKLEVDCEIRGMCPTVSPSLCRWGTAFVSHFCIQYKLIERTVLW